MLKLLIISEGDWSENFYSFRGYGVRGPGARSRKAESGMGMRVFAHACWALDGRF